MLKKPFEVRYDELDVQAHISVISLLRYFEETAALDAAQIAFGWEELQKQNLAWILTHMQLEMLTPHAPKQTVFVRTWHAFSDKILSRREFEITAQNGTVLARGASWWILMDTHKRRITKNPPQLLALNPKEPVYVTQEENFKRALPENAPVYAQKTFTVRSEDLDLNGHVNNVHYAAWALDTGPQDKQLQKLLINFKNECRAGETVDAHSYQETDSIYHHVLTRRSDGKEAARIITFWH